MKHLRPPKCDLCPLHPSHPKYNADLCGDHIPPAGPLDADLMVVGMSGGEEEEERGEPFVGPSGRKLKVALEVMAAGRPLRVRKYNLVNCRTKRKGLQGDFINRDPTAKEIRECTRRWLLPELLTTSALVVPLGQMAYDFLTLYTPERKGDFQPRLLSKGGKIPGGVAGTFQQGIGHRIVVPREFYDKLIEIFTPKKKKEKKEKCQ
jgi:uracil-DNA glycosylase family 4